VETPSGDMARVADGNTGLPKAHGTSIQWDCMTGNKRGICLISGRRKAAALCAGLLRPQTCSSAATVFRR
jgi:hypothetical protein